VESVACDPFVVAVSRSPKGVVLLGVKMRLPAVVFVVPVTKVASDPVMLLLLIVPWFVATIKILDVLFWLTVKLEVPKVVDPSSVRAVITTPISELIPVSDG